MALRRFVSNIFRRQEKPETTSTPAETRDMSGVAGLERLQVERGRIATVKICREMYAGDPRAQKMHRVLARDLVRGGFVVKCDNPDALAIVTEMQTRLSLNQKCEDFTRLTARDGDSFIEIGVDAGMSIAELTRKPTLKMRRHTDAADRFRDPAKAFWMDASDFGQLEPDAHAIWFAEWQMLHLRWNHDEENRYGTAMMSSATKAYRRVDEGELDVSVRRKTRSGVRYHHYVEGGQADVEAYQKVNKRALETPFAAIADYFSNKKGGIEVIEGEGTALNAIDDIRHHIETMATAGEVPLGLLGYGQNLNRDILEDQKAQYNENLEQGREWLTDQFLKPLFERAWLLKGIYPPSLTYSITWRPRVTLTPVLIRDLADALLKLKLLQVSDQDISAILNYFLPGVELSAETLAAANGGDSERFAAMLKGLSI